MITDPHCPPPDFSSSPWTHAVLVMPRHSVSQHGRDEGLNRTSIQGRTLTLAENFAVATKLGGRHANRNERAALPNIVGLSIGVKAAVT